MQTVYNVSMSIIVRGQHDQDDQMKKISEGLVKFAVNTDLCLAGYSVVPQTKKDIWEEVLEKHSITKQS